MPPPHTHTHWSTDLTAHCRSRVDLSPLKAFVNEIIRNQELLYPQLHEHYFKKGKDFL